MKRWVAMLRKLLEHAGLLSAKPRTGSSKACKCGNTELVLLRTYREKLCTDCGATIPWPLDDGQKPLFRPHRSDRKAEVRPHGQE